MTFQLRDLGLYNFLPIYEEYQINGRFNFECLIKIINIHLFMHDSLFPKYTMRLFKGRSLYCCMLFVFSNKEHFSQCTLWRVHNIVICNVAQLGVENGQFCHNRASNVWLEMKIIQNEITGNPTSLPTYFGGKLRFILSVLFPERLRSTAAAHIFGARSNYFVIMGVGRGGRWDVLYLGTTFL